MTTKTLLIVYTDGKEHKVSGVEEYGFMNGEGQYYFKRNGYRSFLPKENIKFFGREFDYFNRGVEN